ncbi:CHASE2 domain-containing protein [Oxynema sp. CENA135]|uniref:CHASE2 domain-containing protein n=1 Tax=Oxynema sp. CENA135 TaxID=984206 RepID=UPI001909669A|nr:CHASE2 domain-containing protein [Oxynema sp. CENA135]MBK4728407.1 CHASE2 domain-containing protein [Oxynema sp. CENA135]
MILKSPTPPIPLWQHAAETFDRLRRLLVVAGGVGGIIIGLRALGLLQTLEWAAYDQLFLLRSPEAHDSRITIVGIEEADLQQLQQWPISDRTMARAIEKIAALEPRAIGLDIFRDLPVAPGHQELQRVFAQTPNAIGIEQLPTRLQPGVPAPEILKSQGRVGFNNVMIDDDRKVRRNLIYLADENGTWQQSFAFKLALQYLQPMGVKIERVGVYSFRLGRATFNIFHENDGGYVRADDGGYQMLANFYVPPPGDSPAQTQGERPARRGYLRVSLTEVLEDRVPQSWMRDRVVLIGSTTTSIKDFFDTPYTSSLLDPQEQVFGVELHANFLGQILSAALDGRPPYIRVWNDASEGLWILGWSVVGAAIACKWRSPLWLLCALVCALGILGGSAFLWFLWGWWIPSIPPLITLLGSTGAIAANIAYQEEKLKRAFAESKDFLNQIINTIPDPIFVKDKNHKWIVLNQAYCELVGQPLEALLDKSEYDFLDSEQAHNFWQQDELVLKSGEAHDHEEQFTDTRGFTHYLATKRSLHKDPAGNLFLVGVIRDITERKKMEEQLKQTARELANSYEELKLSQENLRHQAYHDSLTGLPNRKLFYERLNQALEWASFNNQLVAILFLDLDGFKTINDNFGHDIGNFVLEGVAKRLTGCLRSSDTVARLGGDEFTVILPGIPREQDVASVAQKIMRALLVPFIVEQSEIEVTTSIGISLYPLTSENADELTKQADEAMYRAKHRGKNQYEFF